MFTDIYEYYSIRWPLGKWTGSDHEKKQIGAMALEVAPVITYIVTRSLHADSHAKHAFDENDQPRRRLRLC